MPHSRELTSFEGKSAEYRRTIADVVYDKMIECLAVPEDRFQTITEHKAENFFFDADYLSLYRSENCILIQDFSRRGEPCTKGRVLQSRCRPVAREAAGAAGERLLQPHDR